MFNYKRLSVFLILFYITGCGGGSNEETKVEVESPPEVFNISIKSNFYELIRLGGPATIEVYAQFDDNSEKKLSSEVSFSLSAPELGVITIENDTILFTPESLGSTTIIANYIGFSAQITLKVIDDMIQLSEETLIIPLGSQFPILKNAIHYTSSKPNEPNYDIFEVVSYQSHNTNIADFSPKIDNIIINPSRNLAYGHINTLVPGKVDLSFSYLNVTKNIEVEVAPYKLITTVKTEEEKVDGLIDYLNFDTAIDENSDSFFLTGSMQFSQSLKLSHYSKAQEKWMPDLDISIPQTETIASRAKLIVGEERIIITWPSKEIGYLAIIDKNTKNYDIVEISGSSSIDSIAIDSNNRIMACWGVNNQTSCKIENNGTGWSETQLLPFQMNHLPFFQQQIPLTENNEFFVVTLESTNEMSTVIKGKRLKITDSRIETISDNVVFESNELKEIDQICPHMETSNIGEMACYFIENINTQHQSLYTIDYSILNGWRIEKHFEEEAAHNLTIIRDTARVGINDNGGMLLMWADTTQGEMVTKEYTPNSGWSEKISIKAVGAATPFIEHAPQYTQDGWKTFLSYANAIVTKSEGNWLLSSKLGYTPHDNPFNIVLTIGNPYDDKIAIDFNGNIAMSWRGVWGYHDLSGSLYSNNLFFASPIL